MGVGGLFSQMIKSPQVGSPRWIQPLNNVFKEPGFSFCSFVLGIGFHSLPSHGCCTSWHCRPSQEEAGGGKGRGLPPHRALSFNLERKVQISLTVTGRQSSSHNWDCLFLSLGREGNKERESNWLCLPVAEGWGHALAGIGSPLFKCSEWDTGKHFPHPRPGPCGYRNVQTTVPSLSAGAWGWRFKVSDKAGRVSGKIHLRCTWANWRCR